MESLDELGKHEDDFDEEEDESENAPTYISWRPMPTGSVDYVGEACGALMLPTF